MHQRMYARAHDACLRESQSGYQVVGLHDKGHGCRLKLAKEQFLSRRSDQGMTCGQNNY